LTVEIVQAACWLRVIEMCGCGVGGRAVTNYQNMRRKRLDSSAALGMTERLVCGVKYSRTERFGQIALFRLLLAGLQNPPSP